MRFMVIVKGDQNTEAGVMPSEQELADMAKFNEELLKSGAMLGGDGLHPTSKGARIRYSGGKPTVIDGPFAESKELVAGYWLLRANSKEEVVEWLKRAPFKEGEVEIRQLFELEDFAQGDAIEHHRRNSNLLPQQD